MCGVSRYRRTGMQDFVVDGESRAWSIGFDATKRDGVLVTVGVLVN